VVEGLDSLALTLQGASALIASRGHSLSHEAIAGYYRAVRTERRLLEVNDGFSRMIAEFAKKPREEGLESLINLVIATAASGLADGSIGVKDINLEKLVEAVGRAKAGGAAESAGTGPASPDSAQASVRKGQLSQETLESIRRDVYGF
jgi:hypothetical protein